MEAKWNWYHHYDCCKIYNRSEKKFDLEYAGLWNIRKLTIKGIQKLEMAVQNIISKINKSILYGRMKSRVRTDYWMDFSYKVLDYTLSNWLPLFISSLFKGPA